MAGRASNWELRERARAYALTKCSVVGVRVFCIWIERERKIWLTFNQRVLLWFWTQIKNKQISLSAPHTSHRTPTPTPTLNTVCQVKMPIRSLHIYFLFSLLLFTFLPAFNLFVLFLTANKNATARRLKIAVSEWINDKNGIVCAAAT